MLEAAQNLASLPLPMMFFVLLASSARALGVLFGLWGLYFVLGPAALLRMGLAVILSLPAMVVGITTFPQLIEETPRLILLTIPLREALLGMSLGLLSSLPFFAIMGAGVVIDQYRGDFSPGLTAPESSQVGSFANLKVIMALFLFVEAGGFLIVINALYQSFSLFPPGAASVGINPQFAGLMAEVLQNVFWLLIIVAMPIMIILLLIDFGLSMIFRLAGQIKLPSVDFLIKSLVFVLAMPILVLGVARNINAAFDAAPDPLILMKEFIGDEQ